MFRNATIEAVDFNAEEYHARKLSAQRGAKDFKVSPSMLREFDACPSRWVRGYKPPDTEPKRYGNMLDTFVLTPHLFKDRYVVRPNTYTNEDGEEKKWSGNAKVCRAWIAEQKDKTVIEESELYDCQNAELRIKNDDTLARYLKWSDKQVLVSGEWEHKETGLVIPVECLIDLAPAKVSDFSQTLGDLKTSRCGRTDVFSKFAFQQGYHWQAAFDLDLYNAATGEERDTWCFIISENFSPFEPSKKILSQEFLEIGRGEVNRVLSNYAVCLMNNHWPGYDELGEAAQGWGVVQPALWMANQSAYAARYEAEADEPPLPMEEEHEPIDLIP